MVVEADDCIKGKLVKANCIERIIHAQMNSHTTKRRHFCFREASAYLRSEMDKVIFFFF